MYTVSITSQGQISIPAPLRRKLGLNKNKKAFVSEEKGRIIVEPVTDLLKLQGSLKTNAKVSFKQIRQGFEKYLGQHATSKG